MQFFRATIFLLVLTASLDAQKLTPLAPKPDWSSLDKFQQTITRAEFERLLTTVYAPQGAWENYFTIANDHATVKTSPGQKPFRLEFAPETANAKPVPRYWRGRAEIPRKGKPLTGLHITLDPGHLGGEWARMEERWFQIGDHKPVTEGDMTLHTARLLKAELERLGAKVTMTRQNSRPATSYRPAKLQRAAIASLREQGRTPNPEAVRRESERLFYRTGEIRARADLVNHRLQPDLVLALHFNAEGWGNPARPTLVEANHLHLLVSGSFSAKELSYEDQRYDLMVKLLSRSHDEEVAVARNLAAGMARATGLPPYDYKNNPSALRISGSPFLWARNLLANRLFHGPVIYLEPYVMNNQEVHDRVQLGDYQGRRTINGTPRESIYREYVRGVVDGLVAYYSGKN
jgi:N-acetylmuramoyl-L-alanine amidase